jgi:hypothetical protein
MKQVLIVASAVLAMSLASYVFAEEEKAAKLKEGSAVTAFDPQEGFKLTDSSLVSLGVRFKKISGGGPWSLPKSALVRIKHSSGVYRRTDGWIAFVLAESQGKGSAELTIRSEDLQDGDEVAVEGASFLRMTEADLNSDTVDSCAH